MCFTEWMAILFIRFIIEIKGNVTLFFQLPIFRLCVCAMSLTSISRNFASLFLSLTHSLKVLLFLSLSIPVSNPVFITPIFRVCRKSGRRRARSNKYCCYIGSWHTMPAYFWWLFIFFLLNLSNRSELFHFLINAIISKQFFFRGGKRAGVW